MSILAIALKVAMAGKQVKFDTDKKVLVIKKLDGSIDEIPLDDLENMINEGRFEL